MRDITTFKAEILSLSQKIRGSKKENKTSVRCVQAAFLIFAKRKEKGVYGFIELYAVT